MKNQKKQLKIKIDVDGVIRNIDKPMSEIYMEEFGDLITGDSITKYDVSEVYTKLGDSAADFFFNENGHYVFNKGALLYDKVKDAIDMLRKAGHKVLIVTYQKSIANKIDTIRFLENNDIQYDALFFTDDKELVEGDIMIDDNPSFLLKSKDNTKICIDRAYNRDYNEKGSLRFASLYDASTYILKNF